MQRVEICECNLQVVDRRQCIGKTSVQYACTYAMTYDRHLSAVQLGQSAHHDGQQRYRSQFACMSVQLFASSTEKHAFANLHNSIALSALNTLAETSARR